jgi:hypothetical protein
MRLISLDLIRIEDWLFKVSQIEKNILVVVYNHTFMWSNTRFFPSEESARNWIDYLVLQGKNLESSQQD